MWNKVIYSWLGKPNSLKRSQMIFILIVFVPLITLFIIIRVVPILTSLGISLTNMALTRPITKFIGIRNFIYLIHDQQFISAFFNSIEFFLVATPLEIALGCIFAMMLNSKIKFESFYETLYFIPFIIPTVPATIIWKWFYSPGSFGLANYFVNLLGFPNVPWLNNPKITLLITIGIHVWKNLGYYIIIFLVALKNVPNDIHDASMVDGAKSWQTSIHIDLPYIKPVILFGLMMSTMSALSVFTEVYIMTQGTDISTGAQIQVLVYRIYQEAFSFSNMGRSCAISFIVFFISLGVILLEFKIFRWREM